jgi:aspartate-semialdehyde dehydrogenase
VRHCEIMDYKFTLLVHNTIRGAAGAAILNAELMAERGDLPHRTAVAEGVAAEDQA